MIRLITLIMALVTVLAVNAETFSYKFNSTPLSQAIREIAMEHPDLDINFIYNELENYKTSAKINTDNPYDALRQTIGLNPVRSSNRRKMNSEYYSTDETLINGNSHALMKITVTYTFGFGAKVGHENEPQIAGSAASGILK